MIIDTDPEKFFQVGAQLPTHEKHALIEFLRDNVDIFAWDACEALGINPDFICHHLNVNPSITPRKQATRRSSRDHYEAVKEEVQKLTGMTAALNQFISRSADRCRPFFLLMNKWKGFEWIEECAQAFQQLKDYLSHPPIISSPEADEVLFAYIDVASHVVSLVLIRVDNGKQRPVYYVSKSLHDAEIRYLPLEKAILAVVHGT